MSHHCSTCTCESDAPALLTMGLPVAPQAKERARKGRGGHFYTPDRTATFEERVKWELKASGVRPLVEDGLRLEATFWLPSMRATKRADWDNYAKSLCDAGNGIAWEDDRLITESSVTLRRANNTEPFITFSVRKALSYEPEPTPAKTTRRKPTTAKGGAGR